LTISRNGNRTSRMMAMPLEPANVLPRAGHDFAG
jgi:hypothetical protein